MVIFKVIPVIKVQYENMSKYSYQRKQVKKLITLAVILKMKKNVFYKLLRPPHI